MKRDRSLFQAGRAHVALALGVALGTVAPARAQTATLYDLAQFDGGTVHTLAVDSDGSLWAWGDNQHGQLGNGDGNGNDRKAPVAVAAPEGVAFTQVSAGGGHSLAIASDGTLWAWGRNDSGQVGNGDMSGNRVLAPVQIAFSQPGAPVTHVAAGVDFSIARTSDGKAWAWGGNSRGQLGVGLNDRNKRFTPTPVSGLTNVVMVAAGVDFSLALRSDGAAWAWGANNAGQCGNGSGATADQTVPVQVTGLSGLIAISAGDAHGIALKKTTTSKGTAYSVWGWGSNSRGQLTADPARTPFARSAIQASLPVTPAIAEIAAGGSHNLARRSDGSVIAWGAGTSGQLGNKAVKDSRTAVVAWQLGGVRRIAAGANHSLALGPTRALSSWGSNAGLGQLGNGTDQSWSHPRKIWFFAVGPETGCRGSLRWMVGYDAISKPAVYSYVKGITGVEVVYDLDSSTPADPGRGAWVVELASKAYESGFVQAMASTSLDRYLEQDCRLYAALAGGGGGGGCPTSTAFPQDFGYRKENNSCDFQSSYPSERYQHNLQRTGFEAAWSQLRAPTTSFRTVKVAVLDSGFDWTHRDFTSTAFDLTHSYDVVNGRPSPDRRSWINDANSVMDEDPYRHGTFVTGLIQARTHDTTTTRGIAGGACWGGCAKNGANVASVIHNRVLDANEVGTSAQVAQGIQLALDQGVEVINFSFGSMVDSTTVREACERARLQNGPGGAPTLLVAAAGNYAGEWVMYPAAYDTVLGVGSAADTDTIASWSNYGAGVDVWAPGLSVLSLMGTSSIALAHYGYQDGTSYSAPLVTATAIMARALKPASYHPGLVECTLTDVHGPVIDTRTGNGLLDAGAVLASLPSPGSWSPCNEREPGAPPEVIPPVLVLQDYSGGIGLRGGDVPKSNIQ